MFDIIILYLDIDQAYELEKYYNVNILFYCKNVKYIPTKNELSYINTKRWYKRSTEKITKYDWALDNGYLEVLQFFNNACKLA